MTRSTRREGLQRSPIGAPGGPESWSPEKKSSDTHEASDTDGGELAPGATFGRFRIERLLGSGGMGNVYEAHDASLDRKVALKLLHARSDSDRDAASRRVLREARAVAALVHENVVLIHEVGQHEGTPFLAMELLQGASLRRVMDDGARPLAEKLGWLLQAARALEAAHARGLVHRDVKPENVFVCDDGRVKLLDFGIAKRDAGEAEERAPMSEPSSVRTAEGRVIGTPRYMAPEQRAGASVDARADQFAWGVVAFELLAQEMPRLEAPERNLELLREKAPGLEQNVARAIARALAAAPAERWPSMREIVRALDGVARGRTAPSAPIWRQIAIGFVVAVPLAAVALIAGRATVRPPPVLPLAPIESSRVTAPSTPIASASAPDEDPSPAPSSSAPAPRPSVAHKPKPPLPFDEEDLERKLAFGDFSINSCVRKGDPSVSGVVQITFRNDGRTTDVQLLGAPQTNFVTQCIIGTFTGLIIKAFDGPPKKIRHGFTATAP